MWKQMSKSIFEIPDTVWEVELRITGGVSRKFMEIHTVKKKTKKTVHGFQFLFI